MPMQTRSRTYIARSRPVEMLAEPVTAQYVVETLEGPRTAYVGDYVLIGLQKERWPVQAAVFPNIYEILGPSPLSGQLQVRKKPHQVAAFQIYFATEFMLQGESFYTAVGDFIVRKSADNIYPVKPDSFFEYYEIIRPANSREHFILPY